MRVSVDRRTPAIAIALFARAPVAGEAKTRLIPHLGAEGAARLQALLIRRALRTALEAGLGAVSLWCTPDCAHPLFRELHTELGVSLRPQSDGDLGGRMANAFVELARTSPALLMGTDCPALTPELLHDAAGSLASGSDAVFVPAEDGGYVLVGLRRPVTAVFTDVAWSTDQVMAQTRERLRAAQLTWHELETSWDVDRPQDFERLCASGVMPELAELGPAAAEHWKRRDDDD